MYLNDDTSCTLPLNLNLLDSPVYLDLSESLRYSRVRACL